MVVDCADERIEVSADLVFHALSDATRRDILGRVLAREASVSALARHYPMSFAAIQKHVAVLERALLVRKERRGREQLVRGNIDAVRHTSQLLDHYETLWRSRLEQFEALLDETVKEGPL